MGPRDRPLTLDSLIPDVTRRPEVATIPQLNETQARAVGSFIARCGLDDTVDVTVAEAAMRRDDAIVTSN